MWGIKSMKTFNNHVIKSSLVFFIYVGMVSALPDENKKPLVDPFEKFNQPIISMKCFTDNGVVSLDLKEDFVYFDGLPLPFDGENIIRNKDRNQVLVKDETGAYPLEYFIDFDEKRLRTSILGLEEETICF